MALSSLQTSLRNTWRIACRSNAVEAKKPTTAQVFEHKMVIFRDKWGQLTALQDREGVRGFPMSNAFGNPRTRAIEGFYDKFRYNSDGQLVATPSGPVSEEFGRELDSSLRIPKYHVTEQDGYIWVWTGKGKPEGDPAEIPSIGDYIWNQQTLTINADPNLCLQLEMDWPSSLAQNRMQWAHRRSLIPIKKAMTLEQPYEARTTDDGFTLFQPPTKLSTDTKQRRSNSSTFYLPDRVIHQKFIKRPFWRRFCDFMSVAHFVPLVDPLTGKVTTRAEYMWTPLILPGYAFQRNKITTLPPALFNLLPFHRRNDKQTLEALQANLNYWAAVDAKDVHPHFMRTQAEEEAAQAAAEESGTEVGDVASSTSVTPSYALTHFGQVAFGPTRLYDSPSEAVMSILHHHANGTWNKDTAHTIIPEGRHVGIFRVTHPDS